MKEQVGNVVIEKERVCYTITSSHYYLGGCVQMYNVEGVFYDAQTAEKAVDILKKDKPDWTFEIRENSIITDIYEV